VLLRIWRLLDRVERRQLLLLTPLVLVTAGFELVGVSAVIPFITLLAEPDAALGLPIVGPWIEASGVSDTTVLLRYAGIGLALAVLATNGMIMVTRYRQFRFAANLTYSMSTRLLSHYLAQPYAFTLTRNSATLTNAVMGQVGRVTSRCSPSSSRSIPFSPSPRSGSWGRSTAASSSSLGATSRAPAGSS